MMSGGVDSTTMLHRVHRTQLAVPLFVDYAQKAARKERAVAEQQAAALGLSLQVLDMSAVGNAFRAHQVAKLHVPLPHRNLVVLSLGLSFAVQVGASQVAIAVIADDLDGYASASRTFLATMRAIASSLGDIAIVTPLVDLRKTEVIHEGVRLGVDLTQTHSCMRSPERHCGRCTQCVRRRQSFTEAGVSEPEGFYAVAAAE
jgi:7-cyano-7-deazaguanine synthase